MTAKSPNTHPDPVYIAPSTGIFRLLPSHITPYAELMRIDRPAGFYAFYWHYAIGLSFAACTTSSPPTPIKLSSLSAYLALWVLIFRGTGCTWNDNIDQEFDRQVTRCKFRPIARGAVSTTQAHVFTAAQTIVCAVMLIPFSTGVWIHAAVMTLILGIYPFGKRVTDFPQVILGFAFAIPVFLCSAVLKTDPLLQPLYSSGTGVAHQQLLGTACLYGANTLWTIIFDTVYAHQDIKDDIKAGVKSLAIRLGENTKLGLGILSGIQVGLLVTAGCFCGLNWPYFVVACGGAGSSLFAMLYLVDLGHPASCAWWFGPGSRFVGASVVLGLLGHYFQKIE